MTTSLLPKKAVLERALRWVIWGAIAFLILQVLSFSYGRDQGIYAMVAAAMGRGEMPYRDAWDFKPPGIFLVYGLSRALFGSSQIGIRVLEAIGLVGMCVGLVKLGRRHFDHALAGPLAALLAVLAHAQLDFWHTAQPESFGGMLTIAALWWGVHADDAPAPGPRRLLLAGFLFGLAGLFKPPLAGGGAVLAAWIGLPILIREWRTSIAGAWRAALRPVGIIVLGGAAPFVLCLAWFAAKGALRDLYEVLFVFTPHYTLIGWEGSTVTGMFYFAFTEWLQTYCSALTVGLLLLLGLGRSPRERPFVWLVAALIAMHLAGVALQGKFFPYHYGATWPLTALLAGAGFAKLWDFLVDKHNALAVVFVAIGILSGFGRSATKDTPDSWRARCGKRINLYLSGFKNTELLDQLASVADVSAGANRRVAELIAAQTPPDRPILVWGFEPVIYDLSHRRPATRYLYDVPQRVAWAEEAARAVMMSDLARQPPSAIVVERRDVFPMVTGDVIDSADTIREFPAFADLLSSRYALFAQIEDFDIYLEKDMSEPHDAPKAPPHEDPHAGHHGREGHHGHHEGPPDASGHHAMGMPHRFDDPQKWAQDFDNPERDAWQRPAEVVAVLKLSPGMAVADIGAGTGYFEPHLSAAVGPKGRVYAKDVEESMVRYIGERMSKLGLTNVTAEKVPFDSPSLAASSVDRILIVNTWHHIDQRDAYARKLKEALVPGGFVAVVDFTMEAEKGPPKDHRLSPEAVQKELESAGLTPELATESLPDQYIVLGRRLPTTNP